MVVVREVAVPTDLMDILVGMVLRVVVVLFGVKAESFLVL
jgi:hypothetical protein